MSLIRRTVSALGGILIAVLLIAALAPKATRGVVAALVQVTNTSANPVPTVSVNNLNPFGAYLCLETETSVSGCFENKSYFSAPTATAAGLPVKWLVIDEVDGDCFTYNQVSFINPQIRIGYPPDNAAPGTTQLDFLFPTTLTSLVNFPSRTTFHSISRIYVPANYYVYGSVEVQPDNYANCSMWIMSHLETN
ncbi:MAG: hypothetical protein WBP79_06000 [Candidatus Acidiferrales bacterium]